MRTLGTQETEARPSTLVCIVLRVAGLVRYGPLYRMDPGLFCIGATDSRASWFSPLGLGAVAIGMSLASWQKSGHANPAASPARPRHPSIWESAGVAAAIVFVAAYARVLGLAPYPILF